MNNLLVKRLGLGLKFNLSPSTVFVPVVGRRPSWLVGLNFNTHTVAWRALLGWNSIYPWKGSYSPFRIKASRILLSVTMPIAFHACILLRFCTTEI